MSSTTNPYKKNYRKKRTRRKNNFDRKVERIAKQVVIQQDAKEVEVKLHDIQQSAVGVDVSGTIYQLSSPIARGTTDKQRIGKKVCIKSLLLRYAARYGDDENLLRFIIFRWFRPGAPTVGDVLDYTLTVPWLSPINADIGNFIMVLHDQTLALNNINNAQFVDKVFIKKNMYCEWNENDIMDKGHLFILVLSDSVAIPNPEFQTSARIRFTDQ